MLSLIETQNFDALEYYVAIRTIIVLICWTFMVIACLIDFWSGTDTAKALGEKLISHGFRRTITKMGDYVRVMFFALMFDMLGSLLPFYKIPFVTILATIAVVIIEGKSVIENSRRKKAHAADIPDIVKQIIHATTAKQGHEIIGIIQNLNAKDNEKY
jgi:hypothetical protein